MEHSFIAEHIGPHESFGYRLFNLDRALYLSAFSFHVFLAFFAFAVVFVEYTICFVNPPLGNQPSRRLWAERQEDDLNCTEDSLK